MVRSILFSLMMMAAFLLNACSSAPAKKDEMVLTKADSLAIAAAVAKQVADGNISGSAEEPRLPENIDAAHESFIRALEMEMRGEKVLANVFWQHAAESDPYNRFLTFKMAEMLMAEGNDSLALMQAMRGQNLKGKVLASQLALLAHLYVKAGLADSCRKYFKAALDSSKYQDMTLLYDYSLFLEAVQDADELIRVYDLLLPQVNYMPSLMQRQLNLLLDQHKDSAVVELFGKSHDATGNREYLTKMVQGLVFQRRMQEAKAVVDTLTGSNDDNESMVVLLITSLAETDRAAAYDLLKKKYYEDGVRSPVLTNFLGHYENISGDIDSAKVHLLQAAESLGDQKVYAANAYHALAGIAVKEKRMSDAVRYAEKADSVSMGGEKAMLAMMYGSAKMYDKAYKMLDSLIAVWDKWNPLAGVADSATLLKMNREVERNKLQFRSVYGRILASEAQDILQADKWDSAKVAAANSKREKAQGFYEFIMAADSLNMDVRMLMAMNLERMGRYDEAFKCFEFLLDPSLAARLDRPEVLNYYGYTLIDLNRSPEEVEKGFQMVMEALATEKSKTPTEAYLDSKAWGLYRKGLFEEALKTMKEIKNRNFDEDAVYWEHMAAIQEALGLKAEATESYKKLLKLSPKHPEAKRFLKVKKK